MIMFGLVSSAARTWLTYVSIDSPLIAITGMPQSATSEAATSSWVDRGFDAISVASAPPACSVRARFAVSVVICAQATSFTPSNGFSDSNRSRISRSTGISRSAHSIRCLPCGARLMSLMS